MEWRQLIKNKPIETKINERFVSLRGRIVPLCDTKTNTLYKQLIKYQYKELQKSQNGMLPQPARFRMINGQRCFNYHIKPYERQKYNICKLK